MIKKRTDEPDVEALSKMDIFEKVSNGEWYQYLHEPKVQAIVKKSAQTIEAINDTAKTDIDKANQMMDDFLPHTEDNVEIYYPVKAIEHPNCLFIGHDTFINANFQILASGKVTVGSHCLIGPNCSLFTPNHPVNNKMLRREGWEYDAPITIGDDCWLGGSVIVLPGVMIGDNVIVGAGSIVTKDLPSNTVVAGNPARVIRKLED